MSHGNRNLALARSRYTMTLISEAGQFLDTDVVDGRVRSQTWQFNNRTMFDIDPKYQSACVKLRSLSTVTDTADEDDVGIGTPTVTFHLAGTPMPNNTQSQLPESIGPSSILSVVPTAFVWDVGLYTCTNTTFAGSVAETGRLCAGTVINNDLRVKIQACPMLDENASAAFGLGALAAGIASWTAEIEIQLLVNAPDTDSMDLG
jgi:hypothetical protein